MPFSSYWRKTQVYFNSSETRSNIKDPNLAASKVQTNQEAHKCWPSPWNKGVVLSPELTWDSIQRGPERRETTFTFAILVWFETAFAKRSYLRRRRNIFVDTKLETKQEKSQIWKSYKNNKWIICSFSSIYWKTLEHVLNSVQLGLFRGYYSFSHLASLLLFFKRKTCIWWLALGFS